MVSTSLSSLMPVADGGASSFGGTGDSDVIPAVLAGCLKRILIPTFILLSIFVVVGVFSSGISRCAPMFF